MEAFMFKILQKSILFLTRSNPLSPKEPDRITRNLSLPITGIKDTSPKNGSIPQKVMNVIALRTPAEPANFPKHSPLKPKIPDKALNTFSEEALKKTEALEEDAMLSFDEFKKQRLFSFEQYAKEAKSAFPEQTDEMLRKTYSQVCKSEYRAYVRAYENPGYNRALMIDSYYFNREKK